MLPGISPSLVDQPFKLQLVNEYLPEIETDLGRVGRYAIWQAGTYSAKRSAQAPARIRGRRICPKQAE
jgi:hypothetical protein